MPIKNWLILTRGEFLGGPVGGRADLMIDESSGAINSLVLEKGRFMGFSQGEEIIIPWSAIIKVGKDVIILDINPQKNNHGLGKKSIYFVVNKIPLWEDTNNRYGII